MIHVVPLGRALHYKLCNKVTLLTILSPLKRKSKIQAYTDIRKRRSVNFLDLKAFLLNLRLEYLYNLNKNEPFCTSQASILFHFAASQVQVQSVVLKLIYNNSRGDLINQRGQKRQRVE